MEPINEKAKSKSQQRLMAQALAYKKGDLKKKDINPKYFDKIKELSKSMTKKELEDYAKTKHKGLPKHVKESFKSFSEGYDDPNLRFNSEMGKHKEIFVALKSLQSSIDTMEKVLHDESFINSPEHEKTYNALAELKHAHMTLSNIYSGHRFVDILKDQDSE